MEHFLRSIKISGYTLTDPVCETCDLSVYRATRVLDGLPVLVKVPVISSTSTVQRRLEHEYQIARGLDPSRVSRPLALERNGATWVLVMEAGPTTALASQLGASMEIGRFLQIALGIVAALAELHLHGVVHKDLKPEHVLLDDSSHVWLTGLGIASRLPRERQAPDPPDLIAGTLAYMAPEQTGRMNRSIDSRSDLYSLGVNFYLMLTGNLPFTAGDAMEWVHCHIARQPVPPNQRVPNLPRIISEIVMKLLAKTAEERYQSATGLEADLRHCLAQWRADGDISPFLLGKHDVPDRLLIPERLYGREAEIHALLAAFERVVFQGAPELMLVSGYSGIGKSSVVNELHKVLVPPRGLFSSGKFDQYKRDIPYATLAQALQTLVRQVLGKPEEEVLQWRHAMQEAVGANGQILVSLIPELGVVIGPQPPVPELSPQDAQNRFNTVFRRFLGVFARKEHPLALFLDDLQWLDAATLEFLKHLLSHPEVKYLFLLGAYRDNEVSHAHPLMLALEAIRKSGARVQEIVLAPLTEKDVGRLVADTVRCAPTQAAPLADMVHEKTGGNPFFAIQFLTALAEERLLSFEPAMGAWTWDLDRINAKGYTANVVELMLGKLSRLPVLTQEALKHFACLGNVAPLQTLKLVHGSSEEALHANLWEAVRAGLVFRHDGTYTFLHDRVQEAAYELIPKEKRAAAHLHIGRLLVAQTPAQELEDQIFEITGQLNRGAELIAEFEERELLARLNLRAGKKAKAATAYASACRYLSDGMLILQEKGWELCYELTFSLWFERADCELLISNFEVAAELIEELLARARSKIDRAEAYRLRMVLQLMHANNKPAIRTALECLLLFGMELPEPPTREQVRAEYDSLWLHLRGSPIAGLVELPLMSDPEVIEVMKILSILWRSAYFIDGNLCLMVACRMVNVSMQHGNCDSSVIGYALLSIFIGPVFQKYREGDQFARLAVTVAEKHGFTAQKAGANFLMQMAVIWTCPLDFAVACADAAIRAAQETGEIVYACYSLEHRLTDLIARGDPLEQIWNESVKALDFVLKVKFRHVIDIISSVQPFVQALRGTSGNPPIDEAAIEAQALEGGIAVVIGYHWILQLQRQFLLGTPEEALAYAAKAEPILWSFRCHIQSIDFYFYSSLARAALYPSASPERKASFQKALTDNLEILRRLAESCPATFSHKFTLLAAELARLESRDLEAMRLYKQALGAARENRFVQDEALVCELASAFYRSRGFDEFADIYLQQARDAYGRWGAQGKIRQLEQRFPQLRAAPSLAPTTTFYAPAQEIDLMAVVQASQAISGDIRLDQLLEKLMGIVLENAGAQQGDLLLLREGRLTLAAEARVEKEKLRIKLNHHPGPPEVILPESIVNYVRRSGHRVLLGDATAANPYSADEYFLSRHPKSVLCFPITKQTKLIGLFYLENDLATHAFTLERLTLLELLAAQAAIALENALVYEALQESEAKYRRIIDTANEGIWLLGPDARTTFVNLKMAQMLGYSPEEISGRALPEFMFEEDVLDHLAKMEHRRHGQAENYERRFRHKNGEEVWTIASATPVFDDEHRFQGSFAMLTDITQHKRALEEIRLLNQELEHRVRERTIDLETTNKELEAFSYSVSHDLRAPLRSIEGFSRMVLNNKASQLDEEGRENLARVCAASKRMGQLIEGMLQLSRLSRSVVDRGPLDLSALARSLADELHEVEPQRHVEFVIEPGLVAEADPVLMRSVLENLIGNAWKFTSKRSAAKIEFGRLSQDDLPVYFVRDNGAGFDMEYASNLFGAFQRLHSMEDFPGTGIGLATVQRIIHKHGGQIWAEGEAGKGATFYFTLPKASEDYG